MSTPTNREDGHEPGRLPALDLDEQLGSFVRQHNKRQVFTRLFGAVAGDEMLGRYRLLRHLGQGGMGVVYAAHDETLDRTVAIKLVRTGIGRHRLLREGQAMARLTHPNVVRVYEVGEARSPGQVDDAQLIAYIAMEFVDGVTLGQWLRTPRSPQEIIAAFIAAGRGLVAAHEVGLVHRDFKPQNVLVHRDGRVLVTDFGLAREGSVSTEESGPITFDDGQGVELLTTGGPGGTPAYMAPEAFAGAEVGARSDQFGFCVALWEAVYGRRPFQGATLSELAHDLQTRELERGPPKGATVKLPRGVHEALVRGLAAEPGDRWPDMNALLDQLEAAIATSWRKLGALALFGLVVIGAIVVVLIVLLRSRGLELETKDRDLARELATSEAARWDLEDSLSVQRGMRALALIDDDSEGEALLLGVLAVGTQATKVPPPEACEGLAAVLADDAIVVRPTLRLHGPAGDVSELAVSPRATQVAVASAVLLVWPLDGGAVRSFDGHVGVVHTADFSPDGARLVSGGRDATAKIWTVATGALEHELVGHGADVTVTRFSPNGQVVATASLDHDAKLWDASTGSLLATLRGHQDFIKGLVYAPDGARLATCSYDGSAKLWDASTGALLATLDGHEDVVSAVAFSPDGEELATVGYDGRTRLWDAGSGALEREIERRPEAVYSVAFTPDGRQLATGGRDGEVRIFEVASGSERARLAHLGSVSRIFHTPGGQLVADSPGDATRIWDGETGRLVAKVEAAKFGVTAGLPDGRLASVLSDGQLLVSDPRGVTSEVRRLPGHRDAVVHLAFSLQGTEVATACFGGEVKLWDAQTGALRGTLDGEGGGVLALDYAPSGAPLGMLLAVASEDHHIRLWDPQTQTLRAILRGHSNYAQDLAFSPDGSALASAGLDYTARLWDLETQTSVVLPGHTHGAQCVAFSPDGQRLATTDGAGVLRTWDAREGRLLDACPRHDGQITRLLFSADGEQLASAGVDALVKLGPADGCEPTHTLLGHEDPVLALAFSSDSRVLASAAKQVRLWEAGTGELLAVLGRHDDNATDLVFSPDGGLLAVADLGSTIRVWRVETGELVSTLEGHTGSVRDLAFSPDGSILGSASADHTAKLWDVERGVLRTTLTDRLIRDRGDGAATWPIPPQTLLELGCARLAPFPEYAAAREVCGPAAVPTSRPE